MVQDLQSVLEYPLSSADLSYFVNWGGGAARSLAEKGLEAVADWGIDGKRVLEIGAGRGRMSCLFGIMGAQVTSIDVRQDFPVRALEEARKWNLQDRVSFMRVDGTLDRVPDGTYDLVFTKSMLLYMDDLDAYLASLAAKVKPGGRIFFLENICRNCLDRWSRNLVHRLRGSRNYHYMNPARLASIARYFDLDLVETARNPIYPLHNTPGWYLILGHKA